MELIIILLLSLVSVGSAQDPPLKSALKTGHEPEYITEGRQFISKNYLEFKADIDSHGSVIKYFEELKTFVEEKVQPKNNELVRHVDRVIEILTEMNSNIIETTAKQHRELPVAVEELTNVLISCHYTVESANKWIEYRQLDIKENGKYKKDIEHIHDDLFASLKYMDTHLKTLGKTVHKLLKSFIYLSKSSKKEYEDKFQNLINVLGTKEFLTKTQEAVDKLIVLIQKMKKKEEEKGKGVLGFFRLNKHGYQN